LDRANAHPCKAHGLQIVLTQQVFARAGIGFWRALRREGLAKRRPLIWIVDFKPIPSKFEIKARSACASLIPLMRVCEPNRRRVANYSKGTNA
jgi:hypothetical protein